jgi:hypothetical protein
MSDPLLTQKEERAVASKTEALDAQWSARDISWNELSQERTAINEADTALRVERAQERAEEYLNALLVMVGSRGTKALSFADAFALSDDTAVSADIETHNTKENRAVLHNVLQGLAAMPHEWNTLDTRRFFMGKGEQGKSKYDYPGRRELKDWPEPSVTLICNLLVEDNSLYAQTLRTQGTYELPEPKKTAPDFENDQFTISERVDTTMEPRKRETSPRNVEFIQKLCQILQERDL